MATEIPRFQFFERESRAISFTLRDRNRDPVPVASILTATLTFYDHDLGAGEGSPNPGVINGRQDQDVLNTNGVTFNSSGVCEWTLEPDDNPIHTNRRQVERHIAVFTIATADGQLQQPVEVDVRNLRLVP